MQNEKQMKFNLTFAVRPMLNNPGNINILKLRPDFTSNLVQGLAFGTPKFYIAPYGKINHELVNLRYTCDVKSGLRPDFTSKLVH